MMNINRAKILVLATVTAGMIAACTRAELVNPQSSETEIYIQPTKVEAADSKVNLQTNFEEGDKTGVFVVQWTSNSAPVLSNPINNLVNNNTYTYMSDNLRAIPADKYPEENKVDIYAYSPRISALNSVTNHTFAVQSDQSTKENVKASDLLWAKNSEIEPSASPVKMEFKHLMTKIDVILTIPELNSHLLEITKIDNIRFDNIGTSVAFSLSTGTTTTSYISKPQITPYVEQVGTPGGKTYNFSIIVPAQTFSTVAAFFSFDIYRKNTATQFEDKKTVYFTPVVNMFGTHGLTTVAGSQYTLNMEIAEAWEVVMKSGTTITNWDTQVTQSGSLNEAVETQFIMTPATDGHFSLANLFDLSFVRISTDYEGSFEMDATYHQATEKVTFKYSTTRFPSDNGYRVMGITFWNKDKIQIAKTVEYKSDRVYASAEMNLGEIILYPPSY